MPRIPRSLAVLSLLTLAAVAACSAATGGPEQVSSSGEAVTLLQCTAPFTVGETSCTTETIGGKQVCESICADLTQAPSAPEALKTIAPPSALAGMHCSYGYQVKGLEFQGKSFYANLWACLAADYEPPAAGLGAAPLCPSGAWSCAPPYELVLTGTELNSNQYVGAFEPAFGSYIFVEEAVVTGPAPTTDGGIAGGCQGGCMLPH